MSIDDFAMYFRIRIQGEFKDRLDVQTKGKELISESLTKLLTELGEVHISFMGPAKESDYMDFELPIEGQPYQNFMSRVFEGGYENLPSIVIQEILIREGKPILQRDIQVDKLPGPVGPIVRL